MAETPLDEIKSYTGQKFLTSPSPFMHWLNPTVISAEKGQVILQYTVRQEMTNPIRTLHGGVTAAIIDDIIGLTLYTFNEEFFYTTLNNVIDYFSPAYAGDIILAETLVIKKGRQIVNLQCEIWNENHTRLIARGSSNLLKTNISKRPEATH